MIRKGVYSLNPIPSRNTLLSDDHDKPITRHKSWRRTRVFPAAFVTVLWSLHLALHGFRGDVQVDLAIGRWILSHHAVPFRNGWSQAAYGKPFADSEWLFAFGVAVLYDVGGRWAIFAAGVLCLGALAWMVSGWAPTGRWRWVLIFFIGLLIMPVVPPRPEIVSYVGWAFLLWALDRYRTTGQRTLLWWSAGSTILWTQIHASVVLVPGVLAAEWLGNVTDTARRRTLGGPLLLAIAGTVLRVGGPLTGGAFMRHVLTPGILNHIVEWMPLDPRSWWGGAVIGGIVATWVVVGSAAVKKREGLTLMWLVGGTLAALFFQRLVPYTVIGFLWLWQPVWRQKASGASGAPMQVPLRGWDSVALSVGLLVVSALPLLHEGVWFVPTWPSSVLQMLRRDHATNIVALQGDSLSGAGLQPWVNGEVQLYATQPWWPAWVATVQGQASPAAFVVRYDPTSHWIVWPINTRPGFGPLRLPPPWHVVWQGTIRWYGGVQAVPTAVWTRSAYH